MKVTLIHNPDAGADGQPTPGQLAALIQEAGHKVRVQSIKEDSWSRILRKKVDLVAVAGGDGTVGKVARRLVGEGIPLALLPMGTANNISKSLGIAGRPVTQLIPGWRKARRLKFAAGVASGPWGERHFIEGVGMGLFARVLPRIKRSRTMRNLSGDAKLTYALQLMREYLVRCAPLKLSAALDGRDISGKYLLFEAMNTRYIGPNLFLAPHVDNDGAFLDIVFVTERDRKKLGRYLAGWQDGKVWPSEMGVGRGKRLEFEWTGYPLHLDDKLWPKGGSSGPKRPALVAVELQPAALEFLVPEEDGVPQTGRRRTKNG